MMKTKFGSRTGSQINSEYEMDPYQGPDPNSDLYNKKYTVCPRSSDLIYIVSNYIKRVTTSWTNVYCKSRNILNTDTQN